MKVIVDIDSSLQPLTGIGWYARMLAHYLPEVRQDLEWRLMSRHGVHDTLPDFKPVEKTSRLPGWALDARKLRHPRLDVPLLSGWSQRRLMQAQRRMLLPYTGWLVHGTNFAVPHIDGATVATFHDMTIFTHPQFHPSVRVKRMTQNIEHAADRCTMLITVSQYSRQEMIRLLGISEDRVRVTPLAPRPGFRLRSAEETAGILGALHLRHGRYILFCGTVEPRKNIKVLLQAFLRLPTHVRRRWPLVIAGGAGWNSSEVHRDIARAERNGEVLYTGYVNEASLNHLFSGAAVFVLPSITEGFGLPIIEAMASGVPVLCSTGGSLPEVAGDLSSCFDPHDIDTLKEKLQRVLEDGEFHLEMVSDGLEISARYSWQLCAEQTLSCYEQALKQ